MPKAQYIETFDDGHGGWTGQGRQHQEMRALELGPSRVVARSPFMLDSNHAPPGPGYLQMLFILLTAYDKQSSDLYFPYSGTNRFVEGAYPTDFTNAKLTLRLRGEFRERGAKLVLLVQAKFEDYNLAHLLTGQPFEVEPQWSEQTVMLTTDPDQWTPLGGRWDRPMYRVGPIEKVLRDVNVDIILATYPVEVLPNTSLTMTPELADRHASSEAKRSALDPKHVLWCCQSATMGQIGTRENCCYGEATLSSLAAEL
jgi:hypothetical protein